MTDSRGERRLAEYERWKLRNNWEEIKGLDARIAQLLAHRDKLQRDSDRRGVVLQCSRCRVLEVIVRESGDVATFIKNGSSNQNETICTSCIEATAGIQG
jgi:hypothetical protein